jgi:catechol 2,3-dioxygenase-like lactoylglutathione lyase family enzyme
VSQTIHHMGITVSDIDASVEFYTKGLELTLKLRNEMAGPQLSAVLGVPGTALKTAFLTGANACLELVQYIHPDGRRIYGNNNDIGSAHSCFVVDDIDATFHRLVSLGATYWASPEFAPEIGLKYAFLSDLDNITIELLEFAGPGDFTLDALLAAAPWSR